VKRLPVEDLEHIHHNTQDIWESFRGKSIFLTGGTGFFGKWLLESFIYINEKLGLNARITTLTRNPEKFINEHPFYLNYSNSVRFIKGDILIKKIISVQSIKSAKAILYNIYSGRLPF